MRQELNNLSNFKTTDSEDCSVCQDLLACMGRFFDMLETQRKPHSSDWLTVDEIATELKISKSIVYRLIRQGEIEAINLVVNNNGMATKGHYRIRKSALNEYLESKKVKTLTKQSKHGPRPQRFPNVKNHLGL
ncbi:MAG: helix-turn-helix domain-containing protein [Phycisphaeraceae bacterium]|nr:helix-turn-helix domain-containing protein [Phycisphaeraceae bacterium]